MTRVKAWKVRSTESLVPLRRPAAASEPAIVPRATWGADESIRRAEPSYATELRYAIVHHTAGANGYTKGQAPAILRGIQLYHVQANGWNDIGYNFLVDRFGTVYEGRYGGVAANVIGAQAQGFNTGSVGVALLGTYGSASASTAAEQALVRLLAWRLDLGHVDAGSMLTVVSGGSPKFAAGVPVLLRTVSGHRDVGLTACPGDALYARLQAIGADTRRAGLPKLYEPEVGVEGSAVLFRARLSKSLPWTVSVTDTQGAAVASGSGTGVRLDWAWDAASVAAGDYRWVMSAGSGSAVATPATGIVTAGTGQAALALNEVAVEPGTVSPNGDGVEDTAEIAYTLTTPATVSVSALDSAGAEVAQIEAPRWRRAGNHVLSFDGAGLPDGAYNLLIRARATGGSEVTASVEVTISTALGFAALAPTVLSPNRDGRADTLARGLHAHPTRHRHGASHPERIHRRHTLRRAARGRPPGGQVGRAEDGGHGGQRRVRGRRRRRRRCRESTGRDSLHRGHDGAAAQARLPHATACGGERSCCAAPQGQRHRAAAQDGAGVHPDRAGHPRDPHAAGRRLGPRGQRSRHPAGAQAAGTREVDSTRAIVGPPPPVRPGASSAARGRRVNPAAPFGRDVIEAILPHREPFLLLDVVTALEPGRRVVATRDVREDDWWFAGHFPGRPVMPGVLIVEAMAQAGAVAVLVEEENRGRIAFFAGIDDCRFKRVVEPGDTLTLTCEIDQVRGPIGRGKATAHVGDQLAARGTLTFAVER